MKLFEFMGKEIFSQNGINVPAGRIANNSEEAAAIAGELGEVVLKSQMLFGGRGKAGGIKFANGSIEAKACADELFASELKGQKIERLLVEEKIKIDKEVYISITLDGTKKQPVLIASAHGGVDIEEVSPDKIIKKYIDPEIGVLPHFCREVVYRLGFTGALEKQGIELISKLYGIFKQYDCELVEINPLVISGEKLIAADAKINIDDEAQFRYPSGTPIVEERTAFEKKAHDIGISYVELDGNIAVMANGAGITMTTLDIIQHFGGSPCNFMDAGGGSDSEATAQALEILVSTKPKVILINIFGGITRCDDVAKAFIKVKTGIGIPVPVAIRLSGTNEKEGIEMLREIGIPCYDNIRDAAAKAVEIAKAN